MKQLLTILFALVAQLGASQLSFEIDTLGSFNNEFNQMVCTNAMGRLIVTQRVQQTSFDDRGKKYTENYDMIFARKGASFNELILEEEFSLNHYEFDDGTCCFSPRDSMLYFSTTADYGGNGDNLIQLYKFTYSNGSWEGPIPLSVNLSGYNSAHPAINEKGDLLVFSSDRPGGMGKMDLWYCNLLGNTWSEPVWLGDAINSEGNEVFPTLLANDIYFSSDRTDTQGYDLFVSTKQNQWREISKLLPPFNSAGDDMQCVFLDEETVFISSSREGGAGGDDVYLLRKILEEIEGYTASIECLGKPLRDVQLQFINSLGEVAFSGVSNERGDIELNNLSFERHYSVDVLGIDDDVLSRSVIYVKNSKGEIVKTYRPGKDGQFYFELLKGDNVGGLKKLDNPDESILKVAVQGQIFEEDPGDIGEGELIYVTNDSGELLALTYTTHEGRFQFDELRPLRNYQFKVTEDGKTVRMTIKDGDEDLEIPFINGAASYQKLREEHSIQLIDEHQNPIFIANDEVFIIRNIYYQFDSIAINSIAQGQLEQMGSILKNNPLITIELSSHTDSRGEIDYNLDLSKKRALRAKEYLVSIGVEASRIQSIGYGEKQLLNHCADEVECVEELHALNRRTEIKIHVDD